MAATNIVWLRNDLRVADNPALSAAAAEPGRTVALYVHEQTEGVRPTGAAGRWWLHQSLRSLAADLAENGVELLVESGDSRILLPAFAQELSAATVFWNRRYAPGERETDHLIKEELQALGVRASSLPGNVLVEPWEIATGQGKPYSVFTPFWKTLRQQPISAPQPSAVQNLPAIAIPAVDGDYHPPQWSTKLASHWRVGEGAAHRRLDEFFDQLLASYSEGRDFPHRRATSGLSPHLRFGEISPRQIWHAALALAQAEPDRQGAIEKFLSELAWRDFSYHQLFHRLDIGKLPMQPKYEGMQWRSAPGELTAWQRGQTGIPIVDAGMREMWATGFMQNRVRMLAASFLTKNLLIDWRLGEEWFWDCLVDADPANNPASWQWVAGSGMDAAPYFRIFNPVTQGEKFDADGAYTRHWVPELSRLSGRWLHRPGEAPADVLRSAGIVLGRDYPPPLVDLRTSRSRALEAAAALVKSE